MQIRSMRCLRLLESVNDGFLNGSEAHCCEGEKKESHKHNPDLGLNLYAVRLLRLSITKQHEVN